MGRNFTDLARARALEVRRENAAKRGAVNRLELFIVRSPFGDNGFAWEIRQFGGVVVERSPMGYASASVAKNAGHAALERLQQANPASDVLNWTGEGQFNGGYLNMVKT